MALLFTLLAVAILLALGIRHYLRTGALPPELIYSATPENEKLIGAVARLRQRFWPTPWLLNGHLQLLVLGLKKAFAPRLKYDHVDTLTMADGGTTALNWLGSALPASTPTLLVLHTITGSPHSMRGFVRDLHRATGWRVVLCQRRGHGELRLTSPRFNTMGDTGDLRHQLDVIQARYPDSPLYAAGISAGTGLLVRYLGEVGDKTPLRGAFAYCPGYDISSAFMRSVPFYSRMMARKLLRQFLLPNQAIFQQFESYERFSQAQSLHDFHRHLAEFAGYRSAEEYFAGSNPVLVMHNIAIPVLILNAEDDPVCAIANMREQQQAIGRIPQVIVAVTERGSHCAHLAGWRAEPWAHGLAAEYLLALHAGA